MVVASLVAILLDEAQQFSHLLGDADHVVVSGAAADLAAQRLDFGAQTRGLQRVLHRDREFVEVQRLADEVVGAQLERGLHVLELRVGGDHDDGAGVAGLLQLFQDFNAVGVGQAHIQQHEIGGSRAGPRAAQPSRCQPLVRDNPTLRTSAGETNEPASRRRQLRPFLKPFLSKISLLQRGDSGFAVPPPARDPHE